MTQRQRTVGKWIVRVLLAVVVLVVLYVAFLAFPQPLFAHSRHIGEFAVYSSQPLPDNLHDVVDDARARIEAMEGAQPGVDCRVFICGSQRLFTLFAKLTRRGPDGLAIGLSAFGNIYVNDTKVRRMAAENHSAIRHSRFEGNLAEVIAHEVAHFNVMKSHGYRTVMTMPVWKSEGHAEYQANLAATRADESYAFADRVALYLNTQAWGGEYSFARRLFLWHLLVEYLYEEKRADLVDLLDEGVTEAATRDEMLAWYRSTQSDI